VTCAEGDRGGAGMIRARDNSAERGTYAEKGPGADPVKGGARRGAGVRGVWRLINGASILPPKTPKPGKITEKALKQLKWLKTPKMA